jgi:hypothetical protein
VPSGEGALRMGFDLYVFDGDVPDHGTYSWFAN